MDVQSLENKHKNERVFIIGNGPSLIQTPLEKLENEYTLATNKVFKIFDTYDWRPTYYSLTNTRPDVTIDDINSIADDGTICLITRDRFDKRPDRNDIIPLNVLKPPWSNDPRKDCFGDPTIPKKATKYWSDDVSDCIYVYNSSIYPLFQLANYMGFDEIYLLGCDLGLDNNLQYLSRGDDPYEFLREQQLHPSVDFKQNSYKKFILDSDNKLSTLVNVIYVRMLYAGSLDRRVLFKSGSNPFKFSEEHSTKYDSNLKKYYGFLKSSDSCMKSFINGVCAVALLNSPWSISDVKHIIAGHDPHFTKEYAKNKVRVGEDDRQRRAHMLAREKLIERGVEIENATLGGKLEIHPRIDFDSIPDLGRVARPSRFQ